MMKQNHLSKVMTEWIEAATSGHLKVGTRLLTRDENMLIIEALQAFAADLDAADLADLGGER